MVAVKADKKVVHVTLHGHTWPVYPLLCRGKLTYRVFHRINGERRPKSFSTMAKAKADAKNLLKEIYVEGDRSIHLTDGEKRDWKAAVAVLAQSGIRASLETVCRQYADLAAMAGSSGILTDIIRKHVTSRPKELQPIAISVLRNNYIAMLKKQGRSKRYVQSVNSYTGIFERAVGEETRTDKISRETIQGFLDKRDVSARGKHNFAEAIRTLFDYAKSQRHIAEDWSEINHVALPLVKQGATSTYTAEELTKLLACTPDEFIPCLALAAFGGMRSAEIERISWDNIRLAEKAEKDRIVNLDAHVTKTNSRRSFGIHETLWDWLAPHYKAHKQVWRGGHDRFYLLQQQIANNAGIKWKQNALRHTCLSAKIAIERDVPKTAYECGTSAQMIKRHYLDLIPPSAAEAWFKVNPALVYEFQRREEKKKQK